MSSESDSPEVLGCAACLQMFSCDTYFSASRDPSYQWCIACGSSGLLSLGKLPMVMEDDEKFYLIGDDDGFVTGPYPTQQEAQDSVWSWFNKRHVYGKEAQKSRRKGHLRLAAIEGITLEEEEDVQEEGQTKEGSQEGAEREAHKAPGQEEES